MSTPSESDQNSGQGPDNPLTLDWLVSHLRWPWLVLAFLIAWLGPGNDPRFFPYMMVTIGVGALLNLVQISALFARWYPDWVRIGGIALDTLVSITLLALAGGWKGPMLPVVLFPVLIASLRLGVEAGLAAAVSITFAYGVSAIVDPEFDSLGRLFQVGGNVLVLLGAAAASGLLNRQQKVTHEREEATELKALRRANERARAIYELASTLSATLNYKRVLTTMLDLSMMGLTEMTGPDPSLVGLILLFEEEGNFERLKVHAGRGVPRSDENRVVSGQSEFIARAIYTAEPSITNKVGKDSVLKQFVCTQNARSAICAPFRAGFDSFGVVIFASPNQNYFNSEHSELLTTFCSQAVIALKNAQLYQDLQAEQRRILEKEAEARHKLARELHDGPTQTVSAVAMRLNFVRMMLRKRKEIEKVESEVAKIEELARKTTREIRTMLFTLRPVVLETQGLAAALEQYAERLRQNEDLNVEVDPGGYDGQLDKPAESVVFAVVEEAVGNAKKHAHSNRVLVRLQVDASQFAVEIKDDGIGFNVEDAKKRREAGHMGLLNLEERAELVGGSCLIESQPGAGTLVRLDIPLRRWSEPE